MAYASWCLDGEWIKNCACAYGFPCNFDAKPANGDSARLFTFAGNRRCGLNESLCHGAIALCRGFSTIGQSPLKPAQEPTRTPLMQPPCVVQSVATPQEFDYYLTPQLSFIQ